MRKPTIWVSDQADTNRPVQSQKQARFLKFRTKKEEGLYYPCSENKGADQLRGYREADLRLCFRLCRLLVFLCSGSNTNKPLLNTTKSSTIIIVFTSIKSCDQKRF